MRKYPLGSQDGKGINAEVLVKYFFPYGSGTWLITEAEIREDDIIMYGYCHITEWEWGYVSIKGLEAIEYKGLSAVERDIYSRGKVKDLI